jgi:hypothetical protein
MPSKYVMKYTLRDTEYQGKLPTGKPFENGNVHAQ